MSLRSSTGERGAIALPMIVPLPRPAPPPAPGRPRARPDWPCVTIRSRLAPVPRAKRLVGLGPRSLDMRRDVDDWATLHVASATCCCPHRAVPGRGREQPWTSCPRHGRGTRDALEEQLFSSPPSSPTSEHPVTSGASRRKWSASPATSSALIRPRRRLFRGGKPPAAMQQSLDLSVPSAAQGRALVVYSLVGRGGAGDAGLYSRLSNALGHGDRCPGSARVSSTPRPTRKGIWPTAWFLCPGWGPNPGTSGMRGSRADGGALAAPLGIVSDVLRAYDPVPFVLSLYSTVQDAIAVFRQPVGLPLRALASEGTTLAGGRGHRAHRPRICSAGSAQSPAGSDRGCAVKASFPSILSKSAAGASALLITQRCFAHTLHDLMTPARAPVRSVCRAGGGRDDRPQCSRQDHRTAGVGAQGRRDPTPLTGRPGSAATAAEARPGTSRGGSPPPVAAATIHTICLVRPGPRSHGDGIESATTSAGRRWSEEQRSSASAPRNSSPDPPGMVLPCRGAVVAGGQGVASRVTLERTMSRHRDSVPPPCPRPPFLQAQHSLPRSRPAASD